MFGFEGLFFFLSFFFLYLLGKVLWSLNIQQSSRADLAYLECECSEQAWRIDRLSAANAACQHVKAHEAAVGVQSWRQNAVQIFE